MPQQADEYLVEVMKDDIVVLGTDGYMAGAATLFRLWDNVYDRDLINCISPFLADRDTLLDPELVAEIVAKHAEKFAYALYMRHDTIGRGAETPFTLRAKRQGLHWVAGKPNDITVVVAQIAEKQIEDKSSGKKKREGPGMITL